MTGLSVAFDSLVQFKLGARSAEFTFSPFMPLANTARVLPAEPFPGSDLPMRLQVSEQVSSGLLKVPMLPQVATEVLQAVGDANCDALRLSALIHKDPALAGRVLKIANSPTYMAKSPLVSLQQAVSRLGFATLTEIALAASVQSGVFHVPGLDAELQSMWKMALATASFAKEIARLRRLNVETAFLCGLLADIGRPVVLQAAADMARKLKLPMRDAGVKEELLSIADEFALEATKAVMNQWELPAAVRAAAANRETPNLAEAYTKEAAIAGAARALGLALLHPVVPPKGAPQNDAALTALHENPAFVILNLYRDDAAALVAKGDMVKKAISGLSS